MKKYLIFVTMLTALGLLAAGPFAASGHAFSVVTGESWQALPDSTGDGSPYFDNTGDSLNSSRLSNAGNFTLGTGSWASNKDLSPNLGNAEYLGNADGTAITDFYFQDGDAVARKLLAAAGDAGVSSFGWYEQNVNGTLEPSANRQEIFADGAAVPTTVSPISFTDYFGFYFEDNGVFYYTQSSYNSTDADNQHFALFRPVGGDNSLWYVAVEDLPLDSPYTDKDYNDMYVKVSVAPNPKVSVVPIPGSLLLLGGLFRLVSYNRRRRNQVV